MAFTIALQSGRYGWSLVILIPALLLVAALPSARKFADGLDSRQLGVLFAIPGIIRAAVGVAVRYPELLRFLYRV